MRSKGGEPLTIELVFLGTSALQESLAEVLQGDIELRAVEEGGLVLHQRDGDFGIIFTGT